MTGKSRWEIEREFLFPWSNIFRTIQGDKGLNTKISGVDSLGQNNTFFKFFKIFFVV